MTMASSPSHPDGVYMMKDPERFITRANPRLELLEKHLSEAWVHRIVQGFGGMLIAFFIAFVYFQYLS